MVACSRSAGRVGEPGTGSGSMDAGVVGDASRRIAMSGSRRDDGFSRGGGCGDRSEIARCPSRSPGIVTALVQIAQSKD